MGAAATLGELRPRASLTPAPPSKIEAGRGRWNYPHLGPHPNPPPSRKLRGTGEGVGAHFHRSWCARRASITLLAHSFERQGRIPEALWAWQKVRLGAADTDVVVLDGKALRGSGGTQLVGAINAGSGRTLGVEPVADKSNEIPAGQTLLDRLDLDGTIALMDALHTQVRTAQGIVREGGGDFVLVVKGNQNELQKQAAHFLPEVFSPSVSNGG